MEFIVYVRHSVVQTCALECGAIYKFGKSRSMYGQGESAGISYEVVEGVVRTCFFDCSGERQVTGFYYNGDVFGLEVHAYAESAEAVTDVRVRTWRNLPESGAESTGETTWLLRRAMAQARQRVILLGRKTALQRVAAFILSLPVVNADGTRRSLPMPRTDIADFLGLTMHTVSRVFAGLTRQGVISPINRSYVIIKDVGKLDEISGIYTMIDSDDAFSVPRFE